MPKTSLTKEKQQALDRENKRAEPPGPTLPDLSLTILGSHDQHRENQVQAFAKANKYGSWPVVLFDNGETRTIYADCTVNELGNEEPYSLLSRTQIPLMAGYAITVHKSQVCRCSSAAAAVCYANRVAGHVARPRDRRPVEVI
jgi:hypothetical protein